MKSKYQLESKISLDYLLKQPQSNMYWQFKRTKVSFCLNINKSVGYLIPWIKNVQIELFANISIAKSKLFIQNHPYYLLIHVLVIFLYSFQTQISIIFYNLVVFYRYRLSNILILFYFWKNGISININWLCQTTDGSKHRWPWFYDNKIHIRYSDFFIFHAKEIIQFSKFLLYKRFQTKVL